MRAVIVLLILALILVGFFGWRYHQQDQATIAQQAGQIGELGAQVNKLKDDNNQLHIQLDKIQEENNNLKVYNDALKKALETAKVTGKVPVVPPYPPK